MEITIEQLRLAMKLVVACQTDTLTRGLIEAAAELPQEWDFASCMANGNRLHPDWAADDGRKVIAFTLDTTDETGHELPNDEEVPACEPDVLPEGYRLPHIITWQEEESDGDLH